MAAKPSLAVLALGKMKKPDEAPQEEEGLVTAMEDLLSAIAAKDASGMASAFRSACEMCEGGYDQGGEEAMPDDMGEAQ